MSESSESAEQALERWCKVLTKRIEDSPTAMTDPIDQLAIENAIAAGIAVLADEPKPEPSTEPSTRPILLKDLRITADLVRRALHER